MEYVIILLIAILVFLMWLQLCNSITLKQRSKILNAMGDHLESFITNHIQDSDYVNLIRNESDRCWSSFDQVSYDKHMFYLAFLRNPYELYGDHLQEILKVK